MPLLPTKPIQTGLGGGGVGGGGRGEMESLRADFNRAHSFLSIYVVAVKL